jgi:galactonate dehydratase
MKITKVTPLVLGSAWRNLTFVKVETDEGLTGVGEARVLNRTDAVLGYLSEAVPRYVLGHDPFEIERLAQEMFRGDFGRAGEIVMTAMALVEIACWDIIGKALNQPVYRLLGGAVREKIKAYANGWYTVERTPQEFYTAAKQAVAKGYRALKLDPFGSGFYELEREEKNQIHRAGGGGAFCHWAGCGNLDRDARSLQSSNGDRDGGRTEALRTRLVRGAGTTRKPGSS